MKTLIRNIAQLVAIPPGPAAGESFGLAPIIENAALLITGERIAWFGPAAEAPAYPAEHLLDARGGTVVPGLVDCHTHVVFAGSREREYVQRLRGATYLEILERGGGILDTVRALRNTSLDDLVEQSRPRLRRMLAGGVTTVEAKTGYGLNQEDELKTLLAIQRLNAELPIEIVPTYLGAHTVPPEYAGRVDDYLELMTDPMFLARLRDERLAEFADVFCDRGAFDLDQARRFLISCREYGLRPKIHSEQLSRSGATRLGIALGAVSADHLEYLDDATIAALKASSTIPVVLPGCSFFLGTPPAPVRKMIEAGLPVAMATDCNPGSCMIESLPLIMSIAASLLKMTPLESLTACTANAAAALGRGDRIGAIAKGYLADLLILSIPNLHRWPYQVGVNPVRTVIKRGRIVTEV
jgi:imidazolonepropionase